MVVKLIFDTETTGLCNVKWDIDYMDFHHVVQLSWKSSNGDKGDFYIKPEGYSIPDSAIAVHGITDKMASEGGVPFRAVIKGFLDACDRADKIIGHNTYYDTSTIKANVLRTAKLHPEEVSRSIVEKAVAVLDKDKRIDLMRKTISFCDLPFPSGKKGKKWPSLVELYRKLFNEEFPAHNAWEDVLATERCYYELLRLGVIEDD